MSEISNNQHLQVLYSQTLKHGSIFNLIKSKILTVDQIKYLINQTDIAYKIKIILYRSLLEFYDYQESDPVDKIQYILLKIFDKEVDNIEVLEVEFDQEQQFILKLSNNWLSSDNSNDISSMEVARNIMFILEYHFPLSELINELGDFNDMLVSILLKEGYDIKYNSNILSVITNRILKINRTDYWQYVDRDLQWNNIVKLKLHKMSVTNMLKLFKIYPDKFPKLSGNIPKLLDSDLNDYEIAYLMGIDISKTNILSEKLLQMALAFNDQNYTTIRSNNKEWLNNQINSYAKNIDQVESNLVYNNVDEDGDYIDTKYEKIIDYNTCDVIFLYNQQKIFIFTYPEFEVLADKRENFHNKDPLSSLFIHNLYSLMRFGDKFTFNKDTLKQSMDNMLNDKRSNNSITILGGSLGHLINDIFTHNIT